MMIISQCSNLNLPNPKIIIDQSTVDEKRFFTSSILFYSCTSNIQLKGNDDTKKNLFIFWACKDIQNIRQEKKHMGRKLNLSFIFIWKDSEYHKFAADINDITILNWIVSRLKKAQRTPKKSNLIGAGDWSTFSL